jgi:hypothetical protein
VIVASGNTSVNYIICSGNCDEAEALSFDVQIEVETK